MQQPVQQPAVEPKKRSINVTQIIIAIFIGFFLFSLGVNVGRGNIQFGPGAIKGSVNSSLPDDLDYQGVEAVYDKIRQDFDGDLETEKLLDGLKSGLAQATGDPYTEYFNASAAKEFNEQLSGTFSGIGAELGKDANSNIIVISPIAGYPAEKAGLRAKDVILAVDGKATTGLAVDEAVTKIRGEAGTKVKLKLLRGGSQEIELEITREQITVPSVKSEVVDGIGILTISRFGEDTTQLAEQAAAAFRQQNVRGVVLDLRSNPGGLLDQAVGVSSLWLESGKTVVLEKRDDKVSEDLKARGNAPLKGIKTVVMINEGSASASEIVAGALRDQKAATLLGAKSFGKGSVQQLEDLGNGSLVKITIAHWFTPNGSGIDKKGIEPEKKVERTEDDFVNNRDPQKDAALNFIKGE